MGIKQFAAVITIGGVVTNGLTGALTRTTSLLKTLSTTVGALKTQNTRLTGLATQMERDGLAATRLRTQLQRNIQVIDNLRLAQTRLATSQRRADNIHNNAASVASVGATATVAGAATVAAMIPGKEEATHYQTEQSRIRSLGMGDKTSNSAFKFAIETPTYGTSQVEKLDLLKDGMSAFADLHHAEMVLPLLSKMKFANKAMFSKERGEQNSQQFFDMLKVIETRKGLVSDAEFRKQANIIQQVISATGGRVSATEWRHMLATGGLAGKSMTSESLFYTMEHLVQEMGGDRAGTGLNSLYRSLYQGVAKKRSVMNLDKLGLIGDKSKVKNDKVGQVSHINPGALLGADLFRENPFQWMKQVLLPQLAKKGITSEKEVIDTMGMIVSNSVGGAFLAEMYRQKDNIDKSEKRNRSAYNIDQLDAEAKKTTVGKEAHAHAKMADLKLKLGQQILPLYEKSLVIASTALEKLTLFTEQNPKATQALVVGAAVMGGSLLVLGPILIATSVAMKTYAATTMLFARASAARTIAANARTVTGAVGGMGGMFTRVCGVVPGLLKVIRPLALAFAIAGAPMWVIVAAGAALVAAGVLIYKYWEPLKAFFVGFGTGFIEAVAPIANTLKNAFAPVWEVIQPVVMPILDTVGGWIKSAITWFGELLTPIDKASATTKAWGENGKAAGEMVAKAFSAVLLPITIATKAMQWLSDKSAAMQKTSIAVTPGAKPPNTILGNTQVTPSAKLPSIPAIKPPLPPPPPQIANASAKGGDTVHQSNNFTIVQQPGQSQQELAREVAREVARANSVRARSAFSDGVN